VVLLESHRTPVARARTRTLEYPFPADVVGDLTVHEPLDDGEVQTWSWQSDTQRQLNFRG
jgi:hypothetical protein